MSRTFDFLCHAFGDPGSHLATGMDGTPMGSFQDFGNGHGYFSDFLGHGDFIDYSLAGAPSQSTHFNFDFNAAHNDYHHDGGYEHGGHDDHSGNDDHHDYSDGGDFDCGDYGD